MAIKTFPVVLKDIKQLTPNTRHMVFTRADNETLDFIPGQFISAHFEHEGKELRRSYSIATIMGESTDIEFAISYYKDGPASELFFHSEPGAEFVFSGPYGRLILRDEQPKRYVFIATGTGVTPYRSMLPQLHERLSSEDLQVIVLLGVQRRNDQLYTDDFLKFSNDHPNFEFRIHYSREKDIELASHERLGYVQTAFDELQTNPETDIIYLCGNPYMIDDSFALLKEQGFAVKQVRREKYVS